MITTSKKVKAWITIIILLIIFICIERATLIKNVLYILATLLVLGLFLYKDRDVLAPSNVFVYFYYLFIVYGIVILDFVGYPFYQNMHIWILVSLLCFLTGNLVLIKKKRYSVLKILWKNVNLKKLEKISICVYFLGVFFGMKYIFPNMKFLLKDYENNRIFLQSGNGRYVYMMMLIKLSLLMIYYCHLYYKRNRMLYVYVIFGSILILLSGSRAGLIEIVVGMVLIRNSYSKIKGKYVVYIGIVCIISVALLSIVRSFISGDSGQLVRRICNTMDVNILNLNYVFRTFPQKKSFQHGRTYFMNFLMLLPGPQQDFTLWLKDAIGITFSGGGVTPSIIGECYLNFGFGGICIIMFLLGVYFKRLDVIVEMASNKLPSIILTLYLCKAVTGGIANVELTIIWFEAVLFACFVLTRVGVTNDRCEIDCH